LKLVPYCICRVGNYSVRVLEGLKCNTLNECNYNNGGCEHTCTKIPNSGYQCSCRPGFQLEANKINCASIASSSIGLNRTINCNIRNGGCPYLCNRGTNGAPDQCGCPVGLYLSADRKDCLDNDECSRNTTICSPNLCLNTFGSFRCVTLIFGSPAQPLKEAQQVSDVVGQVSDMNSNVDSISQNNGQLAISYYALIGWVIIITLCLIAVTVVTIRRWYLRRKASTENYDDSSSTSSSFKVRLGSSSEHVPNETHAGIHTSVSRPSNDAEIAVGT